MADFDLRRWLDEEIGLEDPVKHRRNCFNKLVRIYHRHGLEALRIIAEAWAEAQERIKMASQVHWFLRTVKLRLDEAGMWREAGRYSAANLEEILKSGVFASKLRSPLLDGLPPARPEEPERVLGKNAVFDQWRKEGKL